MKKDGGNSWVERFVNITFKVFKNSWVDLLQVFWGVGATIKHRFSAIGLYEVLEFESTLELLDPNGAWARVSKRQKVRYLQDNIVAYQDQAWGDGEVLLRYQCSPGIPVDKYRTGHKTIVLISLREEKNKGDIDEFNVSWHWKNGFLTNTGFWGTHIVHRAKNVKVRVIFPHSRSPQKAWVYHANRNRFEIINSESFTKLPDGRWSIQWRRNNPILYENYVLKWEW